MGQEDSRLLRSPAVGRSEVADREESVVLLCRTQYASLLRLAHSLVGDRGQAEDVVQDAFSSLYAHWGRLREPDAAVPYLRSAVIRGSRLVLRHRSRHGQPPLVLIEPVTTSTEDAVVASDERARLAAAVRALPRRQREVLVCRYYLDLSVADTAALLRITIGSVKKHAHRGIAALGEWEVGNP